MGCHEGLCRFHGPQRLNLTDICDAVNLFSLTKPILTTIRWNSVEFGLPTYYLVGFRRDYEIIPNLRFFLLKCWDVDRCGQDCWYHSAIQIKTHDDHRKNLNWIKEKINKTLYPKNLPNETQTLLLKHAKNEIMKQAWMKMLNKRNNENKHNSPGKVIRAGS